MNRFKSLKRIPLLQALVLLIASAAMAYAQTGGGFDLSWSTVDGGGGTFSTGGSYSLGGTIGQPDAGSSSGGSYTMLHGFWSAYAPLTRTPTPVLTATATNTPTNAPTNTPMAASPTPTQRIIVGHVRWEGRPVQPHPLQQLPITFTIWMSTTEVNYPQMTTDAYGFFTVPVGSLVNGTYNWRVKGPHGTPFTNTGPAFLAVLGSVNLIGAQVHSIEMGLMRAGDANNDNLVDIEDFNTLKRAFGTSLGDEDYDPRADFNGDNSADIADFNLLRGNFGEQGDQPVRPTGE